MANNKQCLPAMPTHHLHDECPLMRVRRRDNGVNRFNDAMQGRICTDGHVSAAKIVIDGADL
jgi:hypothetical protein